LTRIHFPGPLAPGTEMSVPRPQAHHLARVLRLAAGAPVTAFNGDGLEYGGVIARVAGPDVVVRIDTVHASARESALEVILVQGVSRSERMDYTVQKAVELGVARIDPVLTRRGLVRLDATRARQKQAHWQSVAIAACEQCGRNRVPEIGLPRPFAAWLASWAATPGGARGVLLDPAASQRLADLPPPAGGLILIAGPEGGYAGEERRAALDAGCTGVRLGPRVLRTETAALAALAAMQALWGDL
jgi:16S rRNA (uracil1498-N3)-methyltransferase